MQTNDWPGPIYRERRPLDRALLVAAAFCAGEMPWNTHEWQTRLTPERKLDVGPEVPDPGW